MSRKTVVDRTVADEEEGDKENVARLFENSIAVNILYACLDYRPLIGKDAIVERSIMQLARFDALVGTVPKCSEQRARSRGCTQNVYVDTFTSQAREVTKQNIGQVRRSVQIQNPEKLGLPSRIMKNISKRDRKQKVVPLTRRTTQVISGFL